MSSYIVTGATGFFGGRLCEDLLLSGHQVIAVGRNRARLSYLACLGASTIELDLADRACVRLLIAMGAGEPIEAILHCAALTSPHGSRDAHMAANVLSTEHMLQVAEWLPGARFIQISTPSVHAALCDRFDVREDAACPRPLNAYAESKKIAENLVLGRVGDRAVVLRPRGIYGRGDRALLPSLIAAARRGPLPVFGPGEPLTNLTHVDDVVRAVHAAIHAPGAPGRVFHIANTEPLPVRLVAESALAGSGVPVRWRRLPRWAGSGAAHVAEGLAHFSGHRITPPLTLYLVSLFGYTNTLNCDLARDHLGWSAKLSFTEGLRRSGLQGHMPSGKPRESVAKNIF